MGQIQYNHDVITDSFCAFDRLIDFFYFVLLYFLTSSSVSFIRKWMKLIMHCSFMNQTQLIHVTKMQNHLIVIKAQQVTDWDVNVNTAGRLHLYTLCLNLAVD